MASDEDAGLFTPDEYDAEIERLKRERDARMKELNEPKAKLRRQVRRAQILGRVFALHRIPLEEQNLPAICQVAGDDESWLFGPGLLELDGWTLTEDGKTRRPPSFSLDDLNDKNLDD